MIRCMSAAEKIAGDFAERSFLKLWSYRNPRGKAPGKELCDVLVCCEPDVIIISVKDVEVAEGGTPRVAFARWQRKAISASVKQICSACLKCPVLVSAIT